MKKIIIASMISGLSLIGLNANAQVTSNFQSTASLQAVCTMSAQDIAFGQVDLINAPGSVKAVGGITILCSKSTSYTITPLAGYNEGDIQLLRGTGVNKDSLSVQLYKGATGSETVWGRTGVSRIVGVANGVETPHPVSAFFSRFNSPKTYDGTVTNQWNYNAQPDNYAATITATITY